MYEHSLQDKKFWIETLGKPKSHFGGIPKVLPFCISRGELDRERDFFLDKFVRACCKKNYFLLQ